MALTVPARSDWTGPPTLDARTINAENADRKTVNSMITKLAQVDEGLKIVLKL